MLFDGEELLPFQSRKHFDFVSVVYQTTSYFGNTREPPVLNGFDEVVHYTPDLKLHPKENELRLRNIGRELSKNAGCTHHLSSDVDEFYFDDEILKARDEISDEDFTMVHSATYYKDPTYRVKNFDILEPFVVPVDNPYEMIPRYPFRIEITRRNSRYERYKVLDFTMHHMSYVRRDIRKKFANSCNQKYYQIDKFVSDYDKHRVGDRVCLIPDFRNRQTELVENHFNIVCDWLR